MGKESKAWAFDERWYLNCNNWVFFFFPLKRNTVRTNLYAFGKADAGSFDTAFMELYFMKKNIQSVISSGFLSQLTAKLIDICHKF